MKGLILASGSGTGRDPITLVRTIQRRSGLSIGAPEEVAGRQGLLTDDELRTRAEAPFKSGHSANLLEFLERAR